ncbi:hypothetical protein QVD99_004352 [Batrachochytrium dendrobatidis]|nr:hypothetical protein O5D80_002104 [Batrachochytrium dendrobatidis]KAK5669980.1 hypothetical protein QVD99_004352 [Batrachochytrium dendrobatidis]
MQTTGQHAKKSGNDGFMQSLEQSLTAATRLLNRTSRRSLHVSETIANHRDKSIITPPSINIPVTIDELLPESNAITTASVDASIPSVVQMSTPADLLQTTLNRFRESAVIPTNSTSHHHETSLSSATSQMRESIKTSTPKSKISIDSSTHSKASVIQDTSLNIDSPVYQRRRVLSSKQNNPLASQKQSSSKSGTVSIERAEMQLSDLERLQDRMHTIHSKILHQQQSLIQTQSENVHKQASLQMGYMNTLQARQSQSQFNQMRQMRKLYTQEAAAWIEEGEVAAERIEQLDRARAKREQKISIKPIDSSPPADIHSNRSFVNEAHVLDAKNKMRGSTTTVTPTHSLQDTLDLQKQLQNTSAGIADQFESIPSELKVQLDTLHSEFNSVIKAVNVLREAITSQKTHSKEPHTQESVNVDTRTADQNIITSDSLQDIKKLLQISPLDAILAARQSDRRDLELRHQKRNMGASLVVNHNSTAKNGEVASNQSQPTFLSTTETPFQTKERFNYAQVHQRVAELGLKRDALLNDYRNDTTTPDYFQNSISMLESQWLKKSQSDGLSSTRLNTFDDAHVKAQVDKAISQVVFKQKFDEMRGHKPTLSVHPKSAIQSRVEPSAVFKSTIHYSEDLVPTRSSQKRGSLNTISALEDPNTLPIQKNATFVQKHSIPKYTFKEPMVSLNFPQSKPTPIVRSSKPIHQSNMPLQPRPFAHQDQLASALEYQHQMTPPQPQPYPSTEPSPTSPLRALHSQRIGQSSPRPPNFYNVRLSNAPVFLRRTSIRPPSLLFLDHTAKKLDKVKDALPRQSSSPTRTKSNQSPIALQHKTLATMTDPQCVDTPTQTYPIPPQEPYNPIESTRILNDSVIQATVMHDKSQETMPIMVSLGTQVSPSVSIHTHPTKNLNITTRTVPASTKSTGVQHSSPDCNVSVQYSTPDESSSESWINTVSVSRPLVPTQQKRARQSKSRDDFLLQQNTLKLINKDYNDDQLERRIAEWIQNEVLLKMLVKPTLNASSINSVEPVVEAQVQTEPFVATPIPEQVEKLQSPQFIKHFSQITQTECLQINSSDSPDSVVVIDAAAESLHSDSLPPKYQFKAVDIQNYIEDLITKITELELSTITIQAIQETNQEMAEEALWLDAQEARKQELAEMERKCEQAKLEREKLMQEMERLKTDITLKRERAELDEIERIERVNAEKIAREAETERNRVKTIANNAEEQAMRLESEWRRQMEADMLKRIDAEHKISANQLAEDQDLRDRLKRIEESLMQNNIEKPAQLPIVGDACTLESAVMDSSTSDTDTREPIISADSSGSVVQSQAHSQNSSHSCADTSAPIVSTTETTSIGFSVLSTNPSEGEIMTGVFSEGEVVGNLTRQAINLIVHQDQQGNLPSDLDSTSYGGMKSEIQDIPTTTANQIKSTEPNQTIQFDLPDSDSNLLANSSSNHTTSSGQVASPGEISVLETPEITLSRSSPTELSLKHPSSVAATRFVDKPVLLSNPAIDRPDTQSSQSGSSLDYLTQQKLQVPNSLQAHDSNLPHSSFNDSTPTSSLTEILYVPSNPVQLLNESRQHSVFPPTVNVPISVDTANLSSASLSVDNKLDMTYDQQTTVGQVTMMETGSIDEIYRPSISTTTHQQISSILVNTKPKSDGTDMANHDQLGTNFMSPNEPLESMNESSVIDPHQSSQSESQSHLPLPTRLITNDENIFSTNQSTSSFSRRTQQHLLPDPFEVMSGFDSENSNRDAEQELYQFSETTPFKTSRSRLPISTKGSTTGSPPDSHSHSNTHEDLSVTFERISAIETGHEAVDAYGIHEDSSESLNLS